MERLAQAELVGVGRRLRSTAPVELARKTAELQVRVKALARSHVAIVVDVDGELYRCEAEFEAGPYLDRSGASSDWTVLGYVLPYGHFDNKPASREEWAEMQMRRLGEYAKNPLRAWVEVTGSAEVEFMGEAQDAPRGWHSSVAYQNAGSGYAGSSATVSFSFTAGAGSDRAAFLFGAGSRDTRPTSSAITFGGSSPSVALGEVTNTYWRGRGAIVKDTEIDTGAKTVQFVNSGGSGTTYMHAVMAVSFTGVDQTTPNGTAGTAGADSGTALSITVGSPASDSMVVDGWAWVQQNSTNPTIGADQTIRVNGSQVSGIERYVASTQLGSDGGVMSWTKATSGFEYVGMAVEMKAVAAGATNADVGGNLASATSAALAGTVTPVRIVSISGSTSTATSAALAGTVTAQQNVNVSGATATVTAAANSGAVVGVINEAVAGAVATATAAAASGAVAAVRNANAAGSTAAATAAANAGTVTTGANVSVTGNLATATAAANAGAVVGVVNESVAGNVASATAAASSGAVVGVVNENVAGNTATATAAANSGGVATGGNVSVSGSLASATAAALAGDVTSIQVAAVGGETAAATAAAASGSVTTGTNANVTGNTATATASANDGAAVGIVNANVSGNLATAEAAALIGALVGIQIASISGNRALATAAALAGVVTLAGPVSAYVLVLGSNRSYVQVQGSTVDYLQHTGSGNDSITIRGQDQ